MLRRKIKKGKGIKMMGEERRYVILARKLR